MTLSANITLSLGTLQLDVSFEVGAGEVLALLGPNGAGKSTILRTVAGLLALDSGFVNINGQFVDDPAQDIFMSAEERSVGMVFQNYLLFEQMSVLENVAFGLRARGLAKSTSRARARKFLEQVGLTAVADQRPGVLSGGQAQRVALARALAISPEVLLLDEPLSALDAGTRTQVRRDLRHHLDSFTGATLLVTHDPIDAHALADRVLVIENGRTVQYGTLDDITARPRSRYVADLVGLNLVAGDVHDGILTTEDGASVVIADKASGPCLAVIRPHSITLTRQAPQHSSARNSWPGTVIGIERSGDRARIRLDGSLPLTAEITVAALSDLDLRIGDSVHATMKATDIEVNPR